jgi:hypothetical protein
MTTADKFCVAYTYMKVEVHSDIVTQLISFRSIFQCLEREVLFERHSLSKASVIQKLKCPDYIIIIPETVIKM